MDPKPPADLARLRDNALQASRLLKAMSNQHRLLILCQLLKGEHSVGQLAALVGLTQSALSQHLARLRRDDLVQTRRDGQTVRYTLKGDAAGTVLATLHGLYCAPGPRPPQPLNRPGGAG
ncbi:ArsR/SmtB family transcription factor [Roseospirillum parvum]|uniref:DNA-binding transcriptional regulator, ArsR family n=1 Tax=Roseospirillum parvum TaxID=83401 RepID=A0A1G8AKU6_9PROT|nr:metalloregulator ArsR/SmtB family transcription factor [Roseospirillum parvum]SDH21581.1 DNA-binding transcriptional regulator, ArsR family [Roseospirillum parvum]